MNKRKSAPLSNPFSRHSRLDRESSYDESRFLTGSQIKFGMTVGLARVSSYTLAVIFVLLPFHAFFTTWLGASFGHIDLFRIWKELLLVPLTVLALVILARDKGLLAKLKSSWIIRLILGYALLHIVIGLIAFGQHGVTGQALIYSLIINLRLPLIFVICLVIGSKSRWMVDNWQQLILGPAIIVVLFGLLQHFVLGVNFLSHFGYGVGTIPAYQTVDQKIDYVRIQSTLRGSNPLGAYLVLIGVILLAGLVRSKKRGRWKWLVASLATAGALFFTYSRSTWIGMAVAGSAWVFMSIKDVKLRRKLSVVAVGAMITLAGLVVILRDNNLVQNTFFHTDETSHSSLSSNSARASAYSAGIRSVITHPLGDGPGSAGPASFRNNGQARIAENYFIQIAQEVGLLGLAIFIAINWLIAKQLYSDKTELLSSILLASLIGITVINMFLHAWTDDTLSLLWWGLAGVSLAKNYTKKHLSR